MATSRPSAGAGKTSARKTTTRKATQKGASKKTTAKKSTTKKSESGADERPSSGRSQQRASAPRAEAGRRRGALQVAQQAARQLLELTGRSVEGVTGLERTDDGWRVEVEVVEVRRIPDTTDVLATYELTVDEDGELEGYRRLRRYGRGTAEGGR